MSQAGDETTLCGICGSNPNEKRILGCQHLLCKDCADMLADAVKPGVGLSCPFCGQAAERIVDLTIAKPEAAETAHTVAPVPPPPQPHEPPPPPPPVASRVSLDEVVSALSSEQAQALLIELARSMPQVDEVVRARAAAMVVPTPANGREALPSPSAGVSSRGEAGPGSVYQKLSNWRHNRTSTGMIFGCNKATMAECLKRMLFGCAASAGGRGPSCARGSRTAAPCTRARATHRSGCRTRGRTSARARASCRTTRRCSSSTTRTGSSMASSRPRRPSGTTSSPPPGRAAGTGSTTGAVAGRRAPPSRHKCACSSSTASRRSLRCATRRPRSAADRARGAPTAIADAFARGAAPPMPPPSPPGHLWTGAELPQPAPV